MNVIDYMSHPLKIGGKFRMTMCKGVHGHTLTILRIATDIPFIWNINLMLSIPVEISKSYSVNHRISL